MSTNLRSLALRAALPITSIFLVGEALGLERTLDFPDKVPVVLGQGWNTTENHRTEAICISFTKQQLKYQDVKSSVRRVNDKDTTALALKAGYSGTANLLVGSFSTSTEFVFNKTFSSESTYVLATAEVWQAPEFVSPANSISANPVPISKDSPNLAPENLARTVGAYEVHLTEHYAKLAKTSPAAFLKACGDSFVAVIHLGAKLVGTVEISNTTNTEREKISHSVEGSSVAIGGASAGFKGNLEAELNQQQYRDRKRVQFEAYGGTGIGLPQDEAGLLEALRDLPKRAADAPKPFLMTVMDYKSLPEGATLQFPAKESAYQKLFRIYLQLETLLSSIRDVLASQEYPKILDTSEQQLKSLSDQLRLKRQALIDYVQKCSMTQTCETSKWTTWDDYEIRARLPARVRLIELDPNNEPALLIDRLVTARLSQWILDADKLRCDYQNECLLESQKDKYRQLIRSNIERSLQ